MADRIKIISKVTQRWTRYGTRVPKRKAIDERTVRLLDQHTWACQICGEIQPEGMFMELVPFDDMLVEFIRVCPFCNREAKEKGLTYAHEYLRELKGVE